MKKTYALALVLLLVPVVAFGQTWVVAAKKTQLQLGSSLSPAQLNLLLRAVASEVHGGLLVKTEGNNCLGFSCDVLCLAGGMIVDTLGDSEGAATPQWDVKAPTGAIVCDWQPAPAPIPVPVPVPVPIPSTDLAPLATAIAHVQAQLAALQATSDATKTEVVATHVSLEEHRSAGKSFLKDWKMWAAAATSILATWQVTK